MLRPAVQWVFDASDQEAAAHAGWHLDGCIECVALLRVLHADVTPGGVGQGGLQVGEIAEMRLDEHLGEARCIGANACHQV